MPDIYKITINPLSAFMSELQADTIVGHLFWALRFIYDKESFENILQSFETEPVFQITDGFPSGYLPFPMIDLQIADINEIENLIGSRYNVNSRAVIIQLIKKIRKLKYIGRDIFEHYIDNLSFLSLLQGIVDFKICPYAANVPACRNIRNCCVLFEDYNFEKCPCLDTPDTKEVLVNKNRINRITGTVGHGGLFAVKESYLKSSYDIYIKVNNFQVDIIEYLFQYIEKTGYGKRKSVGKGAFKIESFEKTELKQSENPNAFVALNSFIPSANDPTEGNFQILIKRGKIGELQAEFGNPFKKPLFMIRTGSVLQVNGNRKDYYGSFISNVHYDSRVRHYAYCFPLHIRI